MMTKLTCGTMITSLTLAAEETNCRECYAIAAIVSFILYIKDQVVPSLLELKPLQISNDQSSAVITFSNMERYVRVLTFSKLNQMVYKF